MKQKQQPSTDDVKLLTAGTLAPEFQVVERAARRRGCPKTNMWMLLIKLHERKKRSSEHLLENESSEIVVEHLFAPALSRFLQVSPFFESSILALDNPRLRCVKCGVPALSAWRRGEEWTLKESGEPMGTMRMGCHSRKKTRGHLQLQNRSATVAPSETKRWHGEALEEARPKLYHQRPCTTTKGRAF